MNISFFKRYFVMSLIASTWLFHAFGYETPFFYRASNLFNEPRLSKEWLTTLDISLEGGSTKHARNRCHHTVPLFDIYGLTSMTALGVNVPGKDMSNPLDVLLTELSLIAAPRNFGMFSLYGNFSILQSNILFTQNFESTGSCGCFFLQVYLPIKRLIVDDICFDDLTSIEGCPNKNNLTWRAFLLSFDEILARYELSRCKTRESGVGDMCAFLGWTLNHEDTTVLDFVDFTIQAGVLFPTAKKQNINEIFALPLGYNKHWGFPVVADFSFGVYEWLTIGGHFDVLLFAKKNQEIRVKTSTNQSGPIKLAKACASVHRGPIWSGGAFAKADHFCRGLSLWVGYTFNKQNSDTVYINDPKTFNPCIINSDEMLHGWKMHTVSIGAEFDFTQQDCWFGPRFSVFYDRQVGGRYVFKTNIIGGKVSFDFVWSF
jgi:hypothetical protein